GATRAVLLAVAVATGCGVLAARWPRGRLDALTAAGGVLAVAATVALTCRPGGAVLSGPDRPLAPAPPAAPARPRPAPGAGAGRVRRAGLGVRGTAHRRGCAAAAAAGGHPGPRPGAERVHGRPAVLVRAGLRRRCRAGAAGRAADREAGRNAAPAAGRATGR